MSDISRRNLLKGAAVSAVSISAMGLLGACAAPSEPKAETTTDPSAAREPRTCLAPMRPRLPLANFATVRDLNEQVFHVKHLS